MLGKRFQRTTSMAHIGTPNHGTSAAAAEEQPPSSEQQPISQWEILKHADEMMKMMMAAAGGGGSGSGNGGGGQVDRTATAAARNSRGGCGEAGFQHFDRSSSELIPRMDFLDNCFFCKRRLKHERDIFIYGGDAAFCTDECRQRQILKDESRAIGASKSKNEGTAANTETAVAA